MADRNFNIRRALEKNIVDLYLKMTYAPTASTASLATTAPITLTKVALGTVTNAYTFTLQILAAAANPTDTVLAAFTGSAAAIVLTITPNDGTNNSATPVTLTTAEVRELITTGAVAGKTVTVTDGSSLRALQTAAGGGATVVVDAGEGDGLIATFAGAIDFTFISKYGFYNAYLAATGVIRVQLEDKYYELKMVTALIKDATARDITFQLKAESINPSSGYSYIDLYTLTGGSATTVASGSEVWVHLHLKNTSAI